LRTSPSLVLGEAEAALSQLLLKNAVLLAQVVDHLQLMLVHPRGNSDQEEAEWIKQRCVYDRPIIASRNARP
jgi:hypothetical protein